MKTSGNQGFSFRIFGVVTERSMDVAHHVVAALMHVGALLVKVIKMNKRVTEIRAGVDMNPTTEPNSFISLLKM